jgi:lysophospholipase L1-like esterase
MAIQFLIIMLAVVLILFIVTHLAAENLIRHHYAQKVDFFSHWLIKPGDIVFLGDSITDGARWDELFPNLPVKNRGINGDTILGVLQRLGEILDGQPAAIFLLIGTNNLPWYLYHGNEDILGTYEAILQRCHTASPGTRLFVQSILPRRRHYARRICSLNAQLKILAERCGCTYIDLFPHFANSKGEIPREISNDQLHLLAPGYVRWVEILKPYLDELG